MSTSTYSAASVLLALLFSVLFFFVFAGTAAFADHSADVAVSNSHTLRTHDVIASNTTLDEATQARLQGMLAGAFAQLEQLLLQLGHTNIEHGNHSETAHGHTTYIEVDKEDAPTVDIVVHKDPMSGWNVEILTTNFTFSPERASTEHVAGEGHAHIYVDDVKMNRVYGNWYHLANLGGKGEHEIRVDLNGNNHSPLSVQGVPIAATKTIVVE